MARKTGVIVSVVTAESVKGLEVSAQLSELLADFGRIAVVTDHEFQTYYLSNEGVGWKCTDDAMQRVALASKATDEDMSEFIRIFGGRLDSNHAQWYHRITGTW